jgi:hypothetical protein
MSQREYENIPPGLGIIVLGVICIIIGLYLAFFYSGIPYPTFNPIRTSPYHLFGDLVIFAGIIIVLVGAYRQEKSPDILAE